MGNSFLINVKKSLMKIYIFKHVYCFFNPSTSTTEISNTGVRKVTKSNSIVLDQLDACEDYIIDVGLVDSDVLGPLTDTPQDIRTEMDDKAPPKNVNVAIHHDSGHRLFIHVSWDASCEELENPLSYDVSN